MTTVEADATLAAVARFDVAFDQHDVGALLETITDDCVFESTAAPDGTRHVGKDAAGAAWAEFFAASPEAVFETEDQLVCGDRVVVCWRYGWADGHVRGVDIFRVRAGKVSEKLCYVKG